MENIVKNMSFDIAAKLIFEDNGNQPLNSAELWEIMTTKGLVTTKGKTPVATLNTILLAGSINSNLAKKSKRILFELVEGYKPQKFRLVSNSSITIPEKVSKGNISYKDFWNLFLEKINLATHLYRNKKTISSLEYYISASSGFKDANYNCIIGKYACIEIFFYNNKDYFNKLISLKEEIEEKFGHEIIWDYLEGKKGSRIFMKVSGETYNVYNPDNWNNIINFFATNIDKFEKTITSYLYKINSKDFILPNTQPEDTSISGDVWKQGCNWGRGLPSFYEMIKSKEIAICYIDKIYAPGDLVLITEGFNVLAVAKVLETPISVTTLPEYETEFKTLKIEWSNNVHICKVQWYELNQPFEFKLIKGICKVNDPEVIDKTINLWNEKFNPSDANSLSFVQAAIRVLKEVDNKPMTSAEIWQYIVDNSIPLKSKGKTPETTLNALLQRSSENSKFAYKVNNPLFRVLEDKTPVQFVLRRHTPVYVRESLLEEGFLTKESLKSLLSEPYYKDVVKEIVKEILQEQ